MTFVSGFMIYCIIWWVVLFMVLPFGVRTDENPQKGFATSAPKNPHLFKKFAITTGLACLIWGIFQWIMMNGWIRFS